MELRRLAMVPSEACRRGTLDDYFDCPVECPAALRLLADDAGDVQRCAAPEVVFLM